MYVEGVDELVGERVRVREYYQLPVFSRHNEWCLSRRVCVCHARAPFQQLLKAFQSPYK